MSDGWHAHLKQWMIDPQQVMSATCLKVPAGSGKDAVAFYGAAAWKREGDNWEALTEDDSWASVMKVADDGASFATYGVMSMNDAGEEIEVQINEQDNLAKVIEQVRGLTEGDRSKRLPPLYMAGKKIHLLLLGDARWQHQGLLFRPEGPQGWRVPHHDRRWARRHRHLG